MKDCQYAEDRWSFIETIQLWFHQKNQFWLLLTILSFSTTLVLQAIFVFASQENPSARMQSEFLIVPVLVVFVLSSFWRSIVHTFLSFTGAMITYGGMFLFHTANATAQLVTPYVANRLGYGIRHYVVIPPDALADRYFIVGILALAFCVAVSIKPNFFKPKDPDGLPYPVWKHTRNSKIQRSSLIRLISLSALLTYEERHLVARYKYVTVDIGGSRYLVTPYEWIPEGSAVVRDEKSNSIIGIP